MSQDQQAQQKVDFGQLSEQLQQQAQQVLAWAKSMGASDAEVSARVDQGLAVGVRQRSVETLEFSRDQGLGVTVYFGQRQGAASTSSLQPEAIRETVEAACHIARFTEEDPVAGLADAAQMATEFPDLDLDHPWSLTPDEAVDLALSCEAAGLDQAGISNSDGASVNTGRELSVLANSRGFMGLHRGTQHSMSCVLIAGEKADMQRDYWYTTSRLPEGLETAESVGAEAARRALSRLGARSVPTCQVPVLFSPQMSATLVSHFMSAIAGGALYRRSSFLLDALGETLFPQWLNLYEQPWLKQAPGSAAYDRDGVATRENHFVHEGQLSLYQLSVYSARKLGLETTGNAGGVHNLSVSTTGQSQEALLGEMGRGLYVTELMGQGVNMVTGDYSRGAAGFWVENGEIQYPVSEITIAAHLKQLFSQLQAVGADTDRRGNIRTGSWLVDGMTVAGS